MYRIYKSSFLCLSPEVAHIVFLRLVTSLWSVTVTPGWLVSEQWDLTFCFPCSELISHTWFFYVNGKSSPDLCIGIQALYQQSYLSSHFKRKCSKCPCWTYAFHSHHKALMSHSARAHHLPVCYFHAGFSAKLILTTTPFLLKASCYQT